MPRPDTARQYDEVLFYNHHQNKFFDTLGDARAGMNMGIDVLHHAFHALPCLFV